MTTRAPARPSAASAPLSPPRSRADAYALGALTLFWATVLGATGAIASGYHLVDDHEIVRMTAELREVTPWAEASRWLAMDLAWRFRPLYFVHRVAEAAVFGDHLLAWSIYTAGLCLLCSALLYRALRWLAFSPAEALVFAFFGLAGVQASVWWRLGPNETLGMVFLAAGALALGRHARTGSRRARAGLVGAMVLASLCKESFILAIPAVLVAHAWARRVFRAAAWAEAIRGALPEAAALLAVMVAELAFIRLRVGTEGIGYAGVGGLTVGKVLPTAWTIVAFGGLIWPSLAVAALSAAAGGLPRMLRGAVPAVALLVALVAPQAALYTKPGLMERYYLPSVLGPAFLAAACLRLLRTGPDVVLLLALRRTAAGGTPLRPRPLLRPGRAHAAVRLRGRAGGLALAAVALAALAFAQGRTAFRAARWFALEGDQRFVARLAAAPTSGPVLVAGGIQGISECFWSIQWYLEAKTGRRDVYFEFIDHEPRSPFMDGVLAGYRRSDFFRKREPVAGPAAFAAVGVLAGEEAAFLESAAGWFDPAAYRREEVGKKRFAVYVRRDAVAVTGAVGDVTPR